MDIQRPTAPMQPPQPARIITPNNTLSRPATMEYTRPRPDDPNAPSFSPQPDSQRQPQPAAKPKRSKKPLVIFLVAFIVLGLAGGGAYYYFAVYKKPAAAPVAQQSAQTTQTTTSDDTIEATPDGVDKTIQAIDKNMNTLDDTGDFTSNDVSNSNLGL